MDHTVTRQMRRQAERRVRDRATALARANMKLQVEVGQIHREVDHAQRTYMAEHPVGITCTEGCTHAVMGCCRQIVLVTREDVEWLVANEPDAVARALPALMAQVDRLRAEVPGSLWGAFASDEAAYKRLADAYWKLRMPCAFLDGNRCSIYRFRPMPCLTHFVRDDPAKCDSETLVVMEIVAPAHGRDRGAMAMLQLGVQSGTLSVGPLPLMVADVVGVFKARTVEMKKP